jgi:hypothetical protein
VGYDGALEGGGVSKKGKKPAPLRLDLGCGKNSKEGFEGVDLIDFGQKWKLDLRKPWPWKSGSVAEVHASHFVEHLTGPERVHFVNELWRVLPEGGKATLITPHWASCRAYGDYTHQWPPVSEMWFYYLSSEWRAANAPHNNGYKCDFEATWGYSMNPSILARNQEYQTFALSNYKEAAMDLFATLTRRPTS